VIKVSIENMYIRTHVVIQALYCLPGSGLLQDQMSYCVDQTVESDPRLND